MASEAAALRRLTSAAPLPRNGAAMVRYMGGTRQAAQILSGMDGPPPTSLRRSDPERYAAESKAWRTASRHAQRWAKGERGRRLDPARDLDARQRRAAQRENRERRRAEARGAGIRATLRGRIVVVSGRSGRRDSRTRTIRDVPVADSQAVLDALEAGDTELAGELLAEGFWEGAGMPAETEVFGADWQLWPDGEDAP